VSPHWMRHTHATYALEHGVALVAVRDNLRHASISTTSTYLHSDDSRRAHQIGAAFERTRTQSSAFLLWTPRRLGSTGSQASPNPFIEMQSATNAVIAMNWNQATSSIATVTLYKPEIILPELGHHSIR
jgi:hypothetical protein